MAEAELAGQWDCWGWRAGLGQRTLLGQGLCCWAMGLCFSELGAEAGLLSSAVGKPKEARKSGWHLIRGKRWPEMVPLPAHMTQGYGSSFC